MRWLIVSAMLISGCAGRGSLPPEASGNQAITSAGSVSAALHSTPDATVSAIANGGLWASGVLFFIACFAYPFVRVYAGIFAKPVALVACGAACVFIGAYGIGFFGPYFKYIIGFGGIVVSIGVGWFVYNHRVEIARKIEKELGV